MIEITILNYLNEQLDVSAYLEMPVNPPKRFVLIEKTGSGRKNKTESSTFAMQSYAESLFRAAELNDALKRVVENMVLLDDIVSVRLNSDYNFTDTETKKYRYQSVYDIKHY